MNVMQENKLNMYYSVKDVCEEYRPVWIENAVFAATYNLWIANIPLIEDNRDLQTLETTGVTTHKNTKREAMIDKALYVENRLQSYAHVVKNPELLESIEYSVSDMKKARDNEVVGICKAILGRAKVHATEVAAYGATAEVIADLEAAIVAYTDILPKPKLAKSQSKTATENLTALFKANDELLASRMDLDIELFKASAPDFYNQYHAARVVQASKGRSNSVLGSVVLAGSGEPIKGALIRFTATTTGETPKVFEKKSSDKGNFRMKLPEGTYRVTVSKIGYLDRELSVVVAHGETTNVKVELTLVNSH